MLIYLTLYISECLKKLQRVSFFLNDQRAYPLTGWTSSLMQCPNKNEAQKSIATLAVSSFDIPGDSGFPLNSFMAKPGNRAESGGLEN